MKIQLSEFLLFPEEVFRVGNSGSPKLGYVRSFEVNTTILNGVTIIVANGKGLTGYAWKFNRGTKVIQGLRLVTEEPGHYMLAPEMNMPVEKYKGLLEEMGIKCSKYYKVKQGGILVRA